MTDKPRERTFESLIRDLRSPWPWRSDAAATALGALGDTEAVPDLVRVLETPPVFWRAFPLASVRARAAAAHALGQLGDPEAVPVLIPLLDSRHESERLACAEALGSLLDGLNRPGPAILVLAAVHQDDVRSPLRQVEAQAVQALIRFRRPLVIPLVQALRDLGPPDVHFWIQAVHWARTGHFGQHGVRVLASRRAIPALVHLAANTHAEARERVVQGWAELAPHSTDPLLDLLDTRDPIVQVWAAQALQRIGGEHVVGRLTGLLDSSSASRRLTAAIGLLREYPEWAIPHLVAGLESPDAGSRCAAAEELGMAPPGCDLWAALEPLTEALQVGQDTEVRRAIQAAIRKITALLHSVPSELESAPPPLGTGTELEAAERPAGRGTEPEAADE